MLADPEKTVIKMYDVDGPLGIAVRRATYLIDQSRVIQDAVLADFRISRHEDFVRKAVELRRASELRPCSTRSYFNVRVSYCYI